MHMPMLNIRKMRMLVRYPDVLMLMHMRLVTVPAGFVFMLMVQIMAVRVAVFLRLVGVIVFMSLGEVQPYARAH